MNTLLVIGFVVALAAAALHVYIFTMESITWSKPKTWKTFGVKTQEEAEIVKPMAFNQGFYNLFLAVAIIIGFVVAIAGQPLVGTAVALVGAGSMLAAALVLILSNPKLARAAITQGTLPLIAVILLAIGLAA